MTNPFDWKKNRGESTLGQELEKGAKRRRTMTNWVEKQRTNGKEPCYLNLSKDAKPIGPTIKKVAQKSVPA